MKRLPLWLPWCLLALVFLVGADTSPPAQRIHGVVANNAAMAGNPLVTGAVGTAKGTAPATVTAGNVAQLFSDTEHRLFVNTVHPNTFTCLVSAATATTQCAGLSGASLSYYVTDIALSVGATAESVQLVSSTTAGNACATSPANVTPVFNGAINSNMVWPLSTPIKVTANSALCCKPSGSTAFSCQLSGFIGP